MRKIISFLLAIAVILTCVACGNTEESSLNMEPKVSQMKAICELAVMECYYHNVAKYYEKDAEVGFLGFGNKDKHFWVEYSGIVKLGIDVSLVNITVDGTQISITLPEAQVLSCEVDADSLSASSYIVDKNSANITAEDEVTAFVEAQAQLWELAASDTSLLLSAQQRAQTLLEDYITNIGHAVGISYTITWEYLPMDSASTPTGTSDHVPE